MEDVFTFIGFITSIILGFIGLCWVIERVCEGVNSNNNNLKDDDYEVEEEA